MSLKDDTIKDVAEGFKRAKNSAGEAEAQPIPDLIEADKYLRARQAQANRKPLGGIRANRIVPPGTA